MDIDSWFNDPKNIKKSNKNYAHFDVRTNIQKCKNYITIPNNVAHHAFYPFIRYKMIYHRFHKKNGKLQNDNKEREICYSAHIDRCIYQYYSFLLNEKYNNRIKQDGFKEVPIAYRTDLKTDNIKSFRRAINFVKENQPCYIMIGDFTKFFDRINHQYLKEQLYDLLNVDKLPSDYFAIFKSITQFDTWDLDKIVDLNHMSMKDLKALNRKPRILSKRKFKEHKNQIVHHSAKVGIPQGSAISACFANIYMLKIDKEINDFVNAHHGIYMRYSDDFIVILPESLKTHDYIEWIIKYFEDCKKEELLELQPEKTQAFKLDKNSNLVNIGNTFQPKLSDEHNIINFLGFSFDGKEVVIRSKTISKYYYRMRHKAKGIAVHYDFESGYKGSDKLYRLYSKRGAYGKGNFFTYVNRVRNQFPDEPITRPVRRHMEKIRKTLKKYQKR